MNREDKRKILERLEDEREVEFNNGFITAIALFLEHKYFEQQLARDNEKKIIRDSRLYGASDHLFDMEIPDSLPESTKERITTWRNLVFAHRLDNLTDEKLGDSLFKEAEEILIDIDESVFNTKIVKTKYR